MTIDELKKIYNSVGSRTGWDFSKMKDEIEPTPWDYIDIVSRYIKSTDYVLDIGTGGGEKFLKLSKHFSKGVGIDSDINMINTAQDNARKVKNSNVKFKKMGAESIQFKENTFDFVINRHAVVIPEEIAKVLKPGGYFITQQVAEDNMQNIKKIFKYRKSWKNDIYSLGGCFEKNGFKIIASGKYNVQYFVIDIESLIFWLKAINLPEGFNIQHHGTKLIEYIKQYSTPKGFITNESREFLVVKKQ